jgi:hypothetical protein
MANAQRQGRMRRDDHKAKDCDRRHRGQRQIFRILRRTVACPRMMQRVNAIVHERRRQERNAD